MDSSEIEVGGNTYRIGRLTPRIQFNVSKRLAPALFALAEAALKGEKEGDGALKLDDVSAIMAMKPVAEALAKLSDADSDFIIENCISVCSRKVADKWMPVKVPGAATFQFADIGMPEMMQLSFAVIKENLGNFFPAPAEAGEKKA